MTHHRHDTPLGAILKGAVAGIVGTVAMDLVWYMRYRGGGGEQSFAEWEFSSGTEDYEHAAAPAKFGRRLVEGVFDTKLDSSTAGPMNNIFHWATGLAWGTSHGIAAGSMAKPTAFLGAGTGALAWVVDYEILARAGLYEPMSESDPRTLWKDLSAHLVFGISTGVVYRFLARSKD